MILKRFYCVKWVRCETSPTGLWSGGSLVFPVSLSTHSTGDWEQISLRVFFSFYDILLCLVTGLLCSFKPNNKKEILTPH